LFKLTFGILCNVVVHYLFIKKSCGVDESIDSQNRPSISFELDNIGSGLFYGLTKSNIGNRLAIVIRDKVVSAPLIQSAITGKGEIQGQFTIEEIIEMVTSLEKGLSEKKFWEW